MADCSEEQTKQQTGDLSTGQASSAAPSAGLYEMVDTSRPEVVVYDQITHSSEPAYENRPNIDYENVAAYSN